jgi:hypothetical protein
MEGWRGVETWHFGDVAIEGVGQSWCTAVRTKWQLDSRGGTD